VVTPDHCRSGAGATFPWASGFSAFREIGTLSFGAFDGRKGSCCKFNLCHRVGGAGVSGPQLSLTLKTPLGISSERVSQLTLETAEKRG